MMARIIEITRKGYVELWGPGGNRISRHTSEYEAIENIGELGIPGTYRITFPDLEVEAVDSGETLPPPVEPPPPESGVVGPNQWLDVSPQADGGIFENDGISNESARYRVTRMEPLGGYFEWFIGGAFEYTRGGNLGEAWFDYEVEDYDGQGNDLSARVTISVE